MKAGKTLLELAYAFKQTKLWKTVYEEDLFAVDLDGEIGYCSLMGRNGQHTALAVYIGAQGFSSLRDLQEIDQSNLVELLSQDCIQCSLEKREEFLPQELEEIQAYCREAGIAFRAPYPQFSRYYPYCVPCAITNQAEKKYLRTALKVVLAMAEALQQHKKTDLHLRSITFDTKGEAYIGSWGSAGPLTSNPSVTIPLFHLEKGKLMFTDIPLPPYAERKLLPPTRINELALARLKKLPQKGNYQCQIVRMPEPVAGNPPYVPALLLTMNEADGMVLRPATVEGAVYDPDELLEEFLNTLTAHKVYPACIRIQTQETRILLEEFCNKAGIRLEVAEELPEIEEAIEALFDRYGDAENEEDKEPDRDEMMAMLCQMSLSELAGLPLVLLAQLRMMCDMGMLPDELSKKLARIRKN